MPDSRASFTIDIRDFYSKFNNYNRKMVYRFDKWADEGAQYIENYARVNARWRDRTGDLRRTLKGDKKRRRSEYTISIEHGMPYGYWLENYFWGKYAILDEALEASGPVLMERLKDVINERGWL